jgi:hypothetical protein
MVSKSLFTSPEAEDKVKKAFEAAAKEKGAETGLYLSILTQDLEELWSYALPKTSNMMKKIVKSKANSLKVEKESLSPNPGMLSLMLFYMTPWMLGSNKMSVQGAIPLQIEGKEEPLILVVAGHPMPYNDYAIATATAKVASVANLPPIKGGYKAFTDVPLLEQPSAPEFQEKVKSLKEKLTAGDMKEIAKVLKFAVFIFGMRHPTELRGLLDNLEAVQRAKEGAEDGSIDPDEKVSNKEKFDTLSAKIDEGDLASMHKIAVAGISLISIFHIDQLPELFPIYKGIAEKGDANNKEMDDIKTVSVWAVSCFAKFHPDVVTMMKLVE